MMYPRIKRTVEKLETSCGDLVLLRPNGSDIRVERPDEAERSLLANLDGSHSTKVLEDRFGQGAVGDALAQLNSAGLIEDAESERALPTVVRERFDRQLRYLADLAEPTGAGAAESLERLGGCSVAILGVGGLGGRAALELAAIGVGELRLVDGDRVELSNLNRQIQYAEADIGLLKVERTAAFIRAFNSQTKVSAVSERIDSAKHLAEFIAGADLVIDAADWPAHEIERWCNRACFAAGIPYIAMSHYPPMVRVGPLYVPGQTGCYSCQEIAYRRDYPLYDLAIEQRRGQPSVAATLGPACGVTGGLVATEALHFLTGVATPATLGAAYTLDLRDWRLERHEVGREPGCPICSETKEGVRG
jgi:molybdopterin-synthase adenylyltransferase